MRALIAKLDSNPLLRAGSNWLNVLTAAMAGCSGILMAQWYVPFAAAVPIGLAVAFLIFLTGCGVFAGVARRK